MPNVMQCSNILTTVTSIVSEEPTDVKQKTPTGGNHLQAENAQKKQNRQGYTVLTEESMGPLKRWLGEHPSQ
jgi:hypothetical protein